MASVLNIKKETRAIHVELQRLPSFWAEEQGLLANSGLSCPKPGRLNLVLAVDLVVRPP